MMLQAVRLKLLINKTIDNDNPANIQSSHSSNRDLHIAFSSDKTLNNSSNNSFRCFRLLVVELYANFFKTSMLISKLLDVAVENGVKCFLLLNLVAYNLLEFECK
jgi:hypothetical protein